MAEATLIAGLVGTALGLAVGGALWLGERGRRKDLQWLTGHLTDQRADTVRAPSLEEEAEEAVRKKEIEALTDHLEGVAKAEGNAMARKRLREHAKELLETTDSWGGGP